MRAGWLSIVFVVGCSADGLIDVEPQDGDVTELLVDHPEVAFAERAWVLDNTQARLTPGGTVLEGEPTRQRLQAVVVDVGDELGVLYEPGDLQIVVYIDRSDLATVPVEPTWAQGVELPAGLEVEVVERDGADVRVAVENRSLLVDAWLPGSALDHFWYSDMPSRWEPDYAGDAVRLHVGSELLDAPGGEAFASTLDDAFFLWTAGEDGPWRKVEGHVHDWPVSAWVHVDDTETSGLSMSGSASSGWGCSGAFGAPNNLPANTPLFDPDTGVVVGRTVRATYHPLAWFEDEWPTTHVYTPWGEAVVAVDPSDVLR